MSEPAAASAPTAPRRSGRRWLISSALALAALSVVLIWLWRDESPPNVGDLDYVPRRLPDEENAFVVLTRAATRVNKGPWAAEEDRFLAMANGNAWDSTKAAHWLAANEHVWVDVSRAASLPFSQGPVIESLGNMGVIEVGPLRDLAQLAKLRAWTLLKSGNHDEAVVWIGTSLQAASKLEESHSTLIVWMTGLAINGMFRNMIVSMVADAAPSAAHGRELIRALEAARPSPTALANGLRHERVLATLMLAEVQRANPALDSAFTASRRLSLLLKPHETERRHAEILRNVIAHIDADWATLTANVPATNDFVGSGWRRWNPDNLAGRQVLQIVTPTLQALLTKRLHAQTSISAAQAFIAVRLHEAEHGNLPGKLADLVPVYLAQVPRDYFDGAPIRYSRELRAVWSVGRNNLAINAPDAEVSESEIYLKLQSTSRSARTP